MFVDEQNNYNYRITFQPTQEMNKTCNKRKQTLSSAHNTFETG